MTKDMTEGSPVKLILSFALPLLLGNLFQQTYNIIDAAIVGKCLGENALASVGASSSVQFLILGFCIGICCGFAIPVAQYFGGKKYETMRESIFQAGILSAGIAVIMTVLCTLLCSRILHLLSTPENIFQDAWHYLFIIFLGIPFTILYNLLSSIMRAVGDSKTPFFFLAFSTILNIVLDLTFILILPFGVAGAALATILSQAVSGILCSFYICRNFPVLHMNKAHCHIQKSLIRQMLVMGIPMGLQYSITAIGSMVMQSANNGLGSIYISGFTAGMRIKQFLMCPFDAIGTAVSTFCSQNYGARKLARIKTGLKKGIILGVSYGILIGILAISFGRTLSLLFLKASATKALDASGQYLACLGLFFWSLGILNICRLSIQGLGFSGRAIFSGILEMIARIVVSLVFVPIYHFTAICFADQSAWLAACLYILPTCLYCVKKIEQELSHTDISKISGIN